MLSGSVKRCMRDKGKAVKKNVFASCHALVLRGDRLTVLRFGAATAMEHGWYSDSRLRLALIIVWQECPIGGVI